MTDLAPIYNYVMPDGVITVDSDAILAQVISEYLAVYGADLITDPVTPQGMLITAEALSRISIAKNNAALGNQINPNESGGIFLDALLALMSAQRVAAVYSVVVANLTGVAGTIIPKSSLVREIITFQLFQTVEQVTLAVDGTATVNCIALNAGPIAVTIGTLTQIVSSVLGWETITNPAAQSVLGSLRQGDAPARAYRRNVLGIQGSSLAQAITSALYATPGVTSLKFLENDEGITVVVRGVTMVKNSLYVCVSGGDDAAVAAAINSKKSGGCSYNNGPGINKDITITDPFSGQVKHILFDRPNQIDVVVRVTIKATNTSVDPVTLVKNAILAYVNGSLAGEPGLTVGTDVSCFELAGAVNIASPELFVTNLEISLVSPRVFTNTTLPIAVFKQANIIASSISVVQV